jgi:Flp pilus assembly protein TadD
MPILFFEGDTATALNDMNKAVELALVISTCIMPRRNAPGNGKYNEAIADFNKAIRLDPKNAKHYPSVPISISKIMIKL